MLRKLSVIGLAVLAGIAVLPVRADGGDKPMFSFSGFGTLGAVHSSESKADYTANIFQPNGAGHTHDWALGVDSRLGVQIDAAITNNLSAVLQLVSEQRYDNSYKPTVEWANIKYQFTPDLSARIGRIALPLFLSADYRRVGYAMPWVRPPIDMYRLSQVTSNDGMDVNYRFQAGELTGNLQTYFGRRDINTSKAYGQSVVTEARKSFGVTQALEYGPAGLRLGYYTGRLSMPATAPLFNAYRLFGARGQEIANRYDLDNRRYRVISVGANYDPGEWFVTGEWASTTTNSWLGDKKAWYVGGGYRFNQFTPYLIYSQIKSTSATSDPGVPLTRLPPTSIAIAMQLNAGLNELLRWSSPEQRTVAIGTRWDIMANAALKFQFDHIDMGPNSQGTLIFPQPGFVRGGKANVFSVTLDFVF